jgi:uncharacterized protein YdhG (YjbR/CyaY superfamily)
MADTNKNKGTFSDFEREAMKERAKELRRQEKIGKNRKAGEAEIFAKITEMTQEEGAMAKRIHEIVTENAPDLLPKTWYGMPAYANSDGKVICFFQAGSKYEVRYCTFGFNDQAKLDEGNMWAAGFALVKLTTTEEKKIAELVKKAVGK